MPPHVSVPLIAATAAFAAATWAGPPDRSHLTSMSVADLKAIYIACNRQASRTMLDLGTAAQCSMVGEELLMRGFDGDFDRLLDWWRAAPRPAALSPARSAVPAPPAQNLRHAPRA